MNMEELKKNIDSANVVEELITLSDRLFTKSSDNVKKVIEMFITKAYLMGKKNMVKTFDD